MPVAVRNMTLGPAVFFDQQTNLALEWKGKGDPSGEDIQLVPDETFKNSAEFRKAMNRGVFAPVDDSLGDAAMEAQRVAHQANQDEQAAKAIAMVDEHRQQSVLAVPCVGPGSRPDSTCGATTIVAPGEEGDRPPLCATHAHLASNYSASVSYDEKRRPVYTWSRIPATSAN